VSAVLQRGDIIHLAMPLSAVAGIPNVEETRRLVEELSAFYASHGITVGYWSAGSLCPCPTVVAVFRQPTIPTSYEVVS